MGRDAALEVGAHGLSTVQRWIVYREGEPREAPLASGPVATLLPLFSAQQHSSSRLRSEVRGPVDRYFPRSAGQSLLVSAPGRAGLRIGDRAGIPRPALHA